MSGRRRHLITLESRGTTLDSYGDETLTYTTLATAWAEIRMVSGNERFGAMQVQAEVTHRIRFDWTAAAAALTPKDRITYGSRTFDIISAADPTGRQRELEVLAVERV